MTLDEIALLVGEPVEEVRRWQRLGLMADGDNLSTEDLERARLTHFAAHRGVPAEEFARISHESPDMLTPYLRPALRPGRQGALTMSEAAEQAQMDPDLLTASGPPLACGTRPTRTTKIWRLCGSSPRRCSSAFRSMHSCRSYAFSPTRSAACRRQ